MDNARQARMLLAVMKWRHTSGAFIDVTYTAEYGWKPELRMTNPMRGAYAEYREMADTLRQMGDFEDRVDAYLAVFETLNLELPSEEE